LRILNLSKTVAMFAPLAIQQRLFAGKTAKVSFAEKTAGGIEEMKRRDRKSARLF